MTSRTYSTEVFQCTGNIFHTMGSNLPGYEFGQEVIFLQSEVTGNILEFKKSGIKKTGYVSQLVLLWKYKCEARPDLTIEIHNS